MRTRRALTQADTHKGYGFFSEGEDNNGVGLSLRLSEGELLKRPIGSASGGGGADSNCHTNGEK